VKDALVSQLLSFIPLGLGILACVALLAFTIWRPAIGCSVFAFSIALTTGLGRGTIVPLLRPNEVILVVVIVGLVVYHLRRPGGHPITTLDLALGSYTIGTVVIAFLDLFIPHSALLTDPILFRGNLAPLQFLAVYLLFSRTALSSRGVKAVLDLTMLASIVVSLIAVVELASPGFRGIIEGYYPPQPPLTGGEPLYRPISTLGHYAAVGAFGTINYTLALALATHRHPGFPRPWLTLVMIVNLAGLVASLTWAPLLVLPFVTGAVLWHGRRVPGELGVTVLALAMAFVVLWPAVSARSAQQGLSLSGASGGAAVPQTFNFRVQHWQEFYLPALMDHLWLGTGNALPSEVPPSLFNYVDNEYIREGFRAGIVGLTLLVTMMGAIGWLGWRGRASPDPTQRTLGAACLAMAGFFLLVGLTGEYLYFAGVTQEFAMLVGLAGALRLGEPRLALPAVAAPVPRFAAARP
jgi:hypothetical protein